MRLPWRAAQRETPVSLLADNIEHLRIVLTDERFGAVTGFDVTCETKGTIAFELTWNVR